MSKLEKFESPTEDSEVDAAELGLDVIPEAISGVSIPKPVKQNALKAFSRLCSAAIEVPAAYLEGKAAEKRAEAKARVKLIETNATQIARQMEVDPEYAQVAVRKFGQKIVREQVNLDLVSGEAARQLKEAKNAQTEGEAQEIDDDWLNQFEKEASQRSTEDMQRLFGRILAGEIQRPSSFSIKTVKIMGELDAATANLFKKFCSACIVQQFPMDHVLLDARVPSLGGNAGRNALQKYGFGFSQLNILHEYGLIISDYHSWRDYGLCMANKDNVTALSFWHRNTYWALVPMEGREDRQELKLDGVALSQAGRELFGIIDIEPVKNYTDDLFNFFMKQKLKMTLIHNKGNDKMKGRNNR